MFYYLLKPILSFNFILIAAAVIPAVFLMIKVYRADRLEKESPYFLRKLVTAGILSSLLALVEERVLSYVLDLVIDPSSYLYNIVLYFVVVALSEESSKYIFLKRRTWRSEEFNCQFDGVVYAVFVSLGFAIWENISYVLSYGFSTALVRAVTAIPGHACFGVFMGVFYGAAKRSEGVGKHGASKLYRAFALLLPILLHGTYDYFATVSSEIGNYSFIGFVAVMFIVSYVLVGKTSKKDRYIRS